MTYPATRTFWLEPGDQAARGLRRYSNRAGGALGCEAGFHSALTYIDRQPARFSDQQFLQPLPPVSHDDPRWPAACGRCGAPFADADVWQDWAELIYRRPDDGAEFVLHARAGADALGAPSAPPGATWDAWWLPARPGGPGDGISLMVRLPNGHDWLVDAEAANCTRPGQPHACWVRHGDPRSAGVTVDKAGDTCAAGAGSILAGDYHGFLINGELTAG